MQWRLKINIANTQVKYMYLLLKASTGTHVKNGYLRRPVAVTHVLCMCVTCIIIEFHMCPYRVVFRVNHSKTVKPVFAGTALQHADV